ncbi:MAG: hypothetical protein HZA54_10010, partial [Planctomycetes bacterium]|nr:hypothetical protein [Planctomycetota bacterium]
MTRVSPSPVRLERAAARTACLLAAACTVALAGLGRAASAQDKPAFPAEIEVTASSLNVRAGIGQAYVILHTAKQGETLVALDEQLGWFRVKPPAGVHVFLAREFLDMQGADRGVVKGDRVNARPTADTVHPPVCQFAKGTAVRVLGVEKGWYKVPAPANASAWVKKDFVKVKGPYKGPLDAPDGSAQPEGGGVTPPGGTPGAGTPGAGTPAAGTPGAGTPGAGTPGAGMPGAVTPGAGGVPAAGASPVGPDAAAEMAQTLADARRRMADEDDKPLLEQDYSDVIAALRKLSFDPRPSPVKDQAMADLDRLEPLQKIL